MIEHQPNIQTLQVSEVSDQLNSLVSQISRKEMRVLVEEQGILVAAIISAEDLERLDRLDRECARDFAIVDELREAFKGVSEDEIERETDRAIAEIRAPTTAKRR